MEHLLINIRTLHRVTAQHERVKKGAAMADTAPLHHAFVHVKNGRVSRIGHMDELHSEEYLNVPRTDCTGRQVLPGFCDSHTHIVFAKPRDGEFVDRIRGLSYEEIARRGGGILNSAARLRDTSEEQLLQGALERAQEVMRLGTTTIEIKSGYGLTVADELKMLRVANRLKALTPLTIRTTFLGAHAFPLEYKENRAEYVRIVIEEMLPRVAEEKLADFIDVFCDRGFFSVEDTAKILEAGAKFGLRPKIHANELAISGGVQVGIAHRALSVDHLEEMGQEEIDALLASDTLPVALPGCAYFLGIPYAPGRAMIDAGLPLVLATDFNPGSSPSGSMPFVMSLACTRMKLLPEEALTACTLNGAAALDLSHEVGSVSPGNRADLIVTHPMERLSEIPYFFTRNPVERVMVNGKWEV